MNAKRYDLAPADHRRRAACPRPHLVRPGALEPAERPLRLLRPRAAGSAPAGRTAAAASASDGAHPDATCRIRWTCAAVRAGLLPLQRLRQRQHLLRGPRRGLARRRHQRVEPALLYRRCHRVQRRVRHRHPPPARPLVDTAGHVSLARQPRSAWLSPGSGAPAPASTGTGPSPGPAPPASSDPLHPQSSHLVLLECPLLQARRE